jgi:hypothetical protein
LGDFSPFGRLFIFGALFEHFTFFQGKKYSLNSAKYDLGYILDVFSQTHLVTLTAPQHMYIHTCSKQARYDNENKNNFFRSELKLRKMAKNKITAEILQVLLFMNFTFVFTYMYQRNLYIFDVFT